MEEQRLNELIADARKRAEDLRERLADEWKAARLYERAVREMHRRGKATDADLVAAERARKIAAGRWGLIVSRQWQALKSLEREEG